MHRTKPAVFTAVFCALTALWIVPAVLHCHAADFRSPRTAALGGAGRANPVLNDSIYLNPSFASFLPVYSWSANFKALPEGRGRAYNVSVLDGRSELFQAGLAYQVRDRFSAAHFSASSKIGEQTTAGVGLKLFFSKDTSLSSFRDFSASITHVPAKWFQIAAIVENIDPSSSSQSVGLERELILGSRFNLAEKVSIYFDPHLSLESQRPRGLLSAYEVGAELAVFRDLYLRFGKFQNSSILEINGRGTGFGYGLGWITPRLSLDIGIERVLSPVDQLSHTSGATFYF